MASGRGAGTGKNMEKLVEGKTPGGIQYWYDKDDPNWVYLKNDRNAPKYPLSFVWGLAQKNPPAAFRTQNTQEGKSREITAGALGNRVAVIYGQDRSAGDIFWGPRKLGTNQCIVGYGHGEGECTQLVKMELDKRVIAYPGGFYGGAVQHTFYPGIDAPPAADPWFMSATSNQSVERYPGLSFTAVKYTYSDKLPQNIDPLFTVKGVKMVDPRLGLDVSGNPNQPKVWSDNPMLCLVDYMSNTVYGWLAESGMTAAQALTLFNWQSVIDIANWCDEDVGGRKRFTFNWTVRRGADPLEIIDTIRDHFRCTWNFDSNGKIKFYVDRPSASVMTLDEGVNCRALRRDRVPTRDIPGRVVYEWVDPSRNYDTIPCRDAFSKSRKRVAKYNGEGCRNNGQAQSQSNYHYKKRLLSLQGAVEVTKARGITLELYDVVTLNTPSIGLVNFLARIVSIARTPIGTHVIEWEQYDPTIYVDSLKPSETLPDTNLPDPAEAPPNVSLGTITFIEELYQNQPGEWLPRGVLTFTMPTWSFLDTKAEVWVSINGGPSRFWFHANDGANLTPVLHETGSYTLTIFTLNRHSAQKSSGTSYVATVAGVTGTPPEVVDLTTNFAAEPTLLSCSLPRTRLQTLYAAGFWAQQNLTGFAAANVNNGILTAAISTDNFGTPIIQYSDTSATGPWTSTPGNTVTTTTDVGAGIWRRLRQWTDVGTHRWWCVYAANSFPAKRIVFDAGVGQTKAFREALIYWNDTTGQLTEAQLLEYGGIVPGVKNIHVWKRDGFGGLTRMFPPIPASAVPTAAKPLDITAFVDKTVDEWGGYGGAWISVLVTVEFTNGNQSPGIGQSLGLVGAPAGVDPTFWPQSEQNQVALVAGANADVQLALGPGVIEFTGPAGAIITSIMRPQGGNLSVAALCINNTSDVLTFTDSGLTDGQRIGTPGTQPVTIPKRAAFWIVRHVGADRWSITPFATTDSPAFTGTPTVPTPATADRSTKAANTDFVRSAIDTYGGSVNSTTGVSYADDLSGGAYFVAGTAPSKGAAFNSTSTASATFVTAASVSGKGRLKFLATGHSIANGFTNVRLTVDGNVLVNDQNFGGNTGGPNGIALACTVAGCGSIGSAKDGTDFVYWPIMDGDIEFKTSLLIEFRRPSTGTSYLGWFYTTVA